MQFDRKELINEISEEHKMRQLIRKGIHVVLERRKLSAENQLNEERQLRNIIRQLVVEASGDTDVADKVAHQNTGINVLDDLLNNIIKTIEKEYKALTSKEEQRDSFRKHFLANIKNALAPVDVNRYAPIPVEEKVNLEVDETPDEDKFIPVRAQDKEEVAQKKEKEDEFIKISGANRTGANFAEKAFNKVEQQMLDSYENLEDQEDVETFYDYLITNFKLYFDKFEDELSGNLEEPTTDAYEKEAGGGSVTEPVAVEPDQSLPL